MVVVELVYFEGCPNVPLARDRLAQAFAAAGLAPQWREWERNDPASPVHVRAFGSPSILVNGRDVTGMEPSRDDVGACRVYSQQSGKFEGAPAVDILVKALRAALVEAAS